MGKDSTNSGIPVFGEIVKLLLKQEINTIAEELQSDRYKTSRFVSASGHHAVCGSRTVQLIARA